MDPAEALEAENEVGGREKLAVLLILLGEADIGIDDKAHNAAGFQLPLEGFGELGQQGAILIIAHWAAGAIGDFAAEEGSFLHKDRGGGAELAFPEEAEAEVLPAVLGFQSAPEGGLHEVLFFMADHEGIELFGREGLDRKHRFPFKKGRAGALLFFG